LDSLKKKKKKRREREGEREREEDFIAYIGLHKIYRIA
jgi:hypothetical protein